MKIYKIVLANGDCHGRTADPEEALICLAKLASCGKIATLEIEDAHMLKGA